jgi:NADH:ubiquinone oxidoreductase subunit 6 (subunit J)
MMKINIIFIVISVLIILSALYVLYTKSVVHAAFMLLFTFLGIASVFVLAGADFIAISQIMIYVGGILVLIVFGVLLTNKSAQNRTDNQNQITTTHYNRILGLFVAFGIFSGISFVITKIPFARLEGQHFEFYDWPKSTVQNLGIRLVTDNSLPLEAVGILLIGALIGAGFIAKHST